MAVGQGFEPWELLHSTVFKTAAFDHSATPPEGLRLYIAALPRQYRNPLFFIKFVRFVRIMVRLTISTPLCGADLPP